MHAAAGGDNKFYRKGVRRTGRCPGLFDLRQKPLSSTASPPSIPAQRSGQDRHELFGTGLADGAKRLGILHRLYPRMGAAKQ
ncbi:hypothetical protein LNP74_05095 [Klebsiella pneumoniae subsp. pneumoniae]|nr:hypothetical protein [Klebsiella pneumoniae subsp. pneumoniae]